MFRVILLNAKWSLETFYIHFKHSGYMQMIKEYHMKTIDRPSLRKSLKSNHFHPNSLILYIRF
jgi:hypothetical protein